MDDHWLRVAATTHFSSPGFWYQVKRGIFLVYGSMFCVSSFYDAQHG